MTITVEVMQIFNRARAAIAEIEQEKLSVQKRRDQFFKRAGEFKAMAEARMALLGVSLEEIERRIQAKGLNPKGVEMFWDQVPGGKDGSAILLGELGKLLIQDAPDKGQDAGVESNGMGGRKKRVKFSL